MVCFTLTYDDVDDCVFKLAVANEIWDGLCGRLVVESTIVDGSFSFVIAVPFDFVTGDIGGDLLTRSVSTKPVLELVD